MILIWPHRSDPGYRKNKCDFFKKMLDRIRARVYNGYINKRRAVHEIFFRAARPRQSSKSTTFLQVTPKRVTNLVKKVIVFIFGAPAPK